MSFHCCRHQHNLFDLLIVFILFLSPVFLMYMYFFTWELVLSAAADGDFSFPNFSQFSFFSLLSSKKDLHHVHSCCLLLFLFHTKSIFKVEERHSCVWKGCISVRKWIFCVANLLVFGSLFPFSNDMQLHHYTDLCVLFLQNRKSKPTKTLTKKD